MKWLTLTMILLLISCARSPIKTYHQALRKVDAPTSLAHFNKTKSHKLQKALEEQIKFYKKHKKPDNLYFGEKKIATKNYYNALKKLLDFLQTEKNIAKQRQYILSHFQFFEVYGHEDWGKVLVTGYFLPEIKASYSPKKYSYPLFSRPKNMVRVNLKAFADTNDQIAQKFPELLEDKFRGGVLVARKDNNWVLPYYSRKEIEENPKKMRKLANLVAYVDPVDAFFLQIQGSGILKIGKKKITVGYDGQNGHKYVAIGKFLTDHIPLEEMSMQKIRQHLNTLSKEKQIELLHKNPSYVFFKVLPGKAKTYMGTDVIPQVTIATDHQFFPKGALAFLETTMPQDEKMLEFSDFVIDQDTGGAIRGTGRVDLFIGYGDPAGEVAGKLKSPGKLYYLAPKDLLL